MKTMIDTNILYCLSGINEDQQTELLSAEMEKYKPFVISELSLLELFTHPSFNTNQIKKVLSFIDKNKIRYINFLPLGISFLKDLVINPSNDRSIGQLKKRALENKKKIESKTLPLVIVASIVVLALYYDLKTKDMNAKIKLSMHFVSLVESNIEFIRDLSRDTVEHYYINFDKTKFKDEVKSYILMFLYVLTISYSLSENDVLLSDLSFDDMSDEDIEIIESKNSKAFKEVIIRKIKNKNNRGLLCQKYFWDDLDKSLGIYFSSLHKEFNQGIINYYALYIRKMFIEDFKFEKNNLIDSQFHEYEGNYDVFTLDELLTESYRTINPSKYSILRRIQENIKIK